MASRLSIALPVSSIVIGRRERPIDPAAAEMLAVSIEEAGQLQPILVRPIPGDEGETKYKLVVGGHRLTGARLRKWPTIDAVVRQMTDAEALLAEIDENLIRTELTPLQRAEAIARRFEAWSARFPERVVQDGSAPKLKRGRPVNGDKLSQLPPGTPPRMGFAAATAAEVGLSDKTIKRALGVFNGIAPGVRDRLSGTWIGRHDAALRQLAGIADPSEQSAVVDQLLGGRTKSISAARALVAGHEPTAAAVVPADETLKAFRALWGKASPSARDLILDDLAGRKLPKGWLVSKQSVDG